MDKFICSLRTSSSERRPLMNLADRPDPAAYQSFTVAARPRASQSTLDELFRDLEDTVAMLERSENDPAGLRCNAVIFGGCLWDPTWAITPKDAEPCPRPAEWLATITGRARHCPDCENDQPPGCWDCDPLTVAFCDRCFRTMLDFGTDVTGWRI